MIEAEKRLAYKAFGLNILSDISLPELLQTAEHVDQADVIVETVDLSNKWNEWAEPQSKCITKENLVMFQVPETGTFCVENGEKIRVSPMKGFDWDKVRLYILGTCMGALLMQRKILPLHGSVVAINGKAYAFVGERGAGKSTLAAAFLKKGYQLLSDDVIAVSLNKDNTPLVIPSYPQQKLWQESLRGFGMKESQYRPIYGRESKYAVSVHAQFSPEPLLLAGVFELIKSDDEKVEIQPIDGLKRLHTLFRHTYRNFLLPRLGLMEWHFHYTTKMASQLDLFQLQRPLSGFSAHRLVSEVLGHLDERNLNELTV